MAGFAYAMAHDVSHQAYAAGGQTREGAMCATGNEGRSCRAAGEHGVQGIRDAMESGCLAPSTKSYCAAGQARGCSTASHVALLSEHEHARECRHSGRVTETARDCWGATHSSGDMHMPLAPYAARVRRLNGCAHTPPSHAAPHCSSYRSARQLQASRVHSSRLHTLDAPHRCQHHHRQSKTNFLKRPGGDRGCRVGRRRRFSEHCYGCACGV